MPDIRVTHERRAVVLELLTPTAREWVQANVHTEGSEWFGAALHLEPRYALPILRDAHDAGLVVA